MSPQHPSDLRCRVKRGSDREDSLAELLRDGTKGRGSKPYLIPFGIFGEGYHPEAPSILKASTWVFTGVARF